MSFSGVTFVLFCFVYILLLSLKPSSFVQSFFVLRYACAPTATRNYLTTVSVFLFSLEVSLFPIFFCTNTVFSLYEEYVVRFFLPDVFVYLVTTGWIFDISLRIYGHHILQE